MNKCRIFKTYWMKRSNKLIPSGIDLPKHCFLFKIKFKQIFCFSEEKFQNSLNHFLL